MNATRSLRHLRELIAALDSRLPQIERVGEADIAAEAASLRARALERIKQLEAEQGAADADDADSIEEHETAAARGDSE